MWQTQPTTIQDVCTPSHFLPGGSVEPFSQWPLCGTGSLATCHGSVGTHAPGIRRSRALWLALKPSETAARPRQAMRHRWLWLMVPWARQSYSKSPVIPVKYSEIVKLVFFSQIYRWQKRMLLKTQFHRLHQHTSLSLSIVGCFTNIEALLATALGLPEEASCRLIQGAWACLPCFLKIPG